MMQRGKRRQRALPRAAEATRRLPAGKNPADVMHIAGLVERTAEIVWGAQRLGEIVPLPEATNQQFAGYYRYGRTGKF